MGVKNRVPSMLYQILLPALLMVYEVPEGCATIHFWGSGGSTEFEKTTASIPSESPRPPEQQAQGCGKSMVQQRRMIVGGESAELGAWPWLAALGVNVPNVTFDLSCGGSLISSRHVITARHCLHKRYISVRLGDLNLDPNAEDGASPVDYMIEESIVHPENDIAILRLQKDVTFTNLIQPICLPSAHEMKDNTWVGYEPVVAGWGVTDRSRSSDFGRDQMLRHVKVPVWDNEKCKAVYSGISSKFLINETVLCAGYEKGGKDSCQGDSGGPLMIPYGKNSSYYLIGVVSFGRGCARPNVPGAYMRVSKFLDWIEKVTK
ncbi:unnamed protein product [Bemisia tabaci]|uniref:Peptidase S1 domain-containing protein n=3 Tax=Bemisia tabaci TaxID=7038 RepID=A0A9P0A543_BEMTA|nr:unnamed protein product [Bemisia tabaci]